MATIEKPQERALELSRKFLQAFAQTVKLVSLYKTDHPVPKASAAEAWHALHDIFSETGWSEATFGLNAGRWMLNETVLADSARTYELLAIVFRTHVLQSITFLSEAKLFEFAALCELASTPPNRAYDNDASEFLKERGVKNIRVNVEEFVRKRRVKPAATPMIESPVRQALARAEPPAAPAQPLSPAHGFGGFIKNLIDQNVSDPEERAKVYTEAVRLVEQALARHVSEATHKLLLEKQGILNERMRAEHVLAKVADGKMIVDKEGRVLMMDPTAEEIVGRQFVDLAGKPIMESLKTEDQMVALAKDLVIPENRPVSDEVQVGGGDEVAAAFRQSLALVQDEHGRLVGTYAVLPYVAKYREAMRLQEEFITKITHDLKAPLASICSSLEIISSKLKPKLSSEEAGFLDISLRNSRTLSQMIGEILDFSKIKSGRMTLAPVPTAIETTIREAIEALTPWATTKGLALEFRDPEGAARLPDVNADHNRVVQIINNLISNSIKFTEAGGKVTLDAALGTEADTGFVVVTVSDTGCGIAQPDQKRIFEKFIQVSAPGVRREGVGLGLSIVKELVTRHKGRLWLESEVGKGTSFHFSLPLAGGRVDRRREEVTVQDLSPAP